MCLTVYKKLKLKEAKSDIDCYKVVKKAPWGEYVTPYVNSPINMGKVNLAKGNLQYKTIMKSTIFGNVYEIENGLIHCISDKRSAIELCDYLNNEVYFEDICVVVGCKIIKGSKYISGTFDGAYPSIGGKKVKYLDIVYKPSQYEDTSTITAEVSNNMDTTSIF